MCGIVGVIGDVSQKEGETIVARMNRTIVHRGPDDEGAWAGDGVAFGMRRLSIIDLEGGHQPMWTDDSVGIVFNGEIYNYRTLRTELANDGYHFRTSSDTEVVLNLYHRDGLAGINRLEGMFAICLYDPRIRTLYLVRDRLGVKPLYYGKFDGRFYLASEIKAILAGMGRKPALNLQAFHHYLTLRFIPSPETIWQGIYKLEPGHILTFQLEHGSFEIKKFWGIRFNSRPVEEGRDYPREFENLFLSAVEKRLLASDVPVGVLLSGGLDSSAVSAAAVELGHRAFHTFSVGFKDGGSFDETPHARIVAAHIGSQHHEVLIGQNEFLDFLPEMVRLTDEPLADLASIPLYYLCRLARSEVKVVLSGEGSDEILAGYNFEYLAVLLNKLKTLEQVAPKPILKLAARLLSANRYGAALATLSEAGWRGFLSARTHHMTNHWSEQEKRRVWRTWQNYDSTEDLIRSWFCESTSDHPIDQLQQVYCREWLVEDLLMKADKMSMANSLELRVPFLDHALVEWTAQLPLSWKVGDRSSGPASKRILREFARKRLPRDILTRPKQGFPVPAYRWLSTSLGDWAEDLLCCAESRVGQFIDVSAMQPVLAASCRGDTAAAHKIWVMIIAEYWMREWL